MFFDFTLLYRQNNGKFLLAWKAATLGVKAIPQKKILEVKIDDLCDELAKYITSNATSPKRRFSLRLSSFLLSGTIRLYREQVVIELDEIVKFLTTIKKPLEVHRSKVKHGDGSSEETDFSIFPTPPMRKPKVRGIKRTRPQQESQETPEGELQELQRTLDNLNKEIELRPPVRQDEITMREDQPLHQDQFPSAFGTLGLPGIVPFDLDGILDLPGVVREPSRGATTEGESLIKKPSRKRKPQEADKENIPPSVSQTSSSGSGPQTPGANQIVTLADVHVDADVSSPKKPRTPKKHKTPETKRQVQPSTDLDLIEEIETAQVSTPNARQHSVVEPPTIIIEEIVPPQVAADHIEEIESVQVSSPIARHHPVVEPQVSPQVAAPAIPVQAEEEEEERFPFPSVQQTRGRPKHPILNQAKFIPKVKRKVVGRRDCRLKECDLNELFKSSKNVCHDFDNDYDEQSFNLDEILNQLPPIITATPHPPVELIPPEELALPPSPPPPPPPSRRQRTLEISAPRPGPSVRFSDQIEEIIEFKTQQGIDNTVNDTVAVAAETESGTAFLENVVMVEVNTPSAQSALTTPLLPSIQEEDINIPQSQETPKSRRPRFGHVESPPACADSHARQKTIMSLIEQEDRVYTIEEVCPRPVNRFNIACTFGDLLALSGRRYLELVSEEDSLELNSIFWGQRLKK